MGQLGNTPRQHTLLTLEARKSFALGLQFQKRGGAPVDITGAMVHLVVKQPAYLGGLVVVDELAEILDGPEGLAQFALQAADLDLDPGEHDFSVTLIASTGYSTVVLKGTVDVRENTESSAIGSTYTGVSPATNLAVYLEDGGQITVQVASVDGVTVQGLTEAQLLDLDDDDVSALRVQQDARNDARYDARYPQKAGRPVALTDAPFNAKADGVTDDTAAVQAFLDYLSANGGVGLWPAAAVRVTTQVSVTANAKPFTVLGAGEDVSVLISDKAAAGNAVSLVQAVGVRVKDLTIDGVSTATTNHGISAANCTDCKIVDVTVRNHGYSAGMFYKNTGFTGTSERNRFIRCTSRSGGSGRNGFLLESSKASTMLDCQVFDGIVASPGYGLQIKHAGENCAIIGGYVENAVAAVAFGNEDNTLIAKGNRVSGVVARNCTYGFIGGYCESNDVELTVRMESNAANQNAVRITQGSKYNRVRAKVTNPAGAAVLAYVKETGNLVELDVNALGTATVAQFEAGSDGNDVVLHSAGDKTAFGLMSAPVVNNGGTGNRVGFGAHQRELHASPGVTTSTQRFTNSSGGNAAWIQYNHSAKYFIFRVDGADELGLDSTALFPASDLGLAAGKVSQRFTEVWTKDGLILSSPNGTKYRVKVSDAGALSAVVVP